MAWDMRPVDLEFFDTAPHRFVATEIVHQPGDRVFAAIADDPAGWGTWFPGFSRAGRYVTPPPHGVGSTREVAMGGVHYVETVLAWEPPFRWAFYVARAGLPLAAALAEDYRVAPHGDHSVVQATLAIDPRPVGRPLMPLAKFAVPVVFRRAFSNLGAHLAETAPSPA